MIAWSRSPSGLSNVPRSVIECVVASAALCVSKPVRTQIEIKHTVVYYLGELKILQRVKVDRHTGPTCWDKRSVSEFNRCGIQPENMKCHLSERKALMVVS